MARRNSAVADAALEIDAPHPMAMAEAERNAAIGKLETLMRNRRGPYWKGPRAHGLQARYLALVAARDAALQWKGGDNG